MLIFLRECFRQVTCSEQASARKVNLGPFQKQNLVAYWLVQNVIPKAKKVIPSNKRKKFVLKCPKKIWSFCSDGGGYSPSLAPSLSFCKISHRYVYKGAAIKVKHLDWKWFCYLVLLF